MLITLTSICADLLRLKLITETVLLGAILAGLALIAGIVWKRTRTESLQAKLKQFQVCQYIKPTPVPGRYVFPWEE
jgi:glycerol kinase